MSDLKYKCVNDLLGEKFFIPDYQRGYRWQSTEVKNLLVDIKKFFDKDNLTKDNYYCLQPLVVCKSKKMPGYWEVIDGQQRLTTICIILNNLKKYLEDDEKENFLLDYETRNKSFEYLQNIIESEKDKNIDFYHMYQANLTIKTFFKDKNNSKGDFYTSLTNSDERGKNVRFIWYDVTDEIDSGKVSEIDIFTRLNIGKIPLTNAELLKALFLSNEYLSEDPETAKEIQVRIAQDWDRMEKQLQKEDFWYFIYGNGTHKYDTRIEFLFDLLIENYHKNDEEERHTFNTYYNKFEEDEQNKHSIAEIVWKDICNLYGVFENWYEDRELYHLIGFNTAMGYSINSLYKDLKKSSSNTEFKNTLLSKAKGEGKKILNINSLYYGNPDVKKALLLFNILTILNNKKSEDRFPFHYYLKQDWQIEHVSPQTEQDINNKDRKNWLIMNISYFTGVKLPLRAEDFKESKFIEDAKKSLPPKDKEKELVDRLILLLESNDSEQDKIRTLNILRKDLAEFFNEADAPVEKDHISNLVLLDSATNEMYHNAFFPVKRKWIIEREKEGIFIPLCTKNVFMKAYSNNFLNLTAWTKEDAEAYAKELKSILNPEMAK